MCAKLLLASLVFSLPNLVQAKEEARPSFLDHCMRQHDADHARSAASKTVKVLSQILKQDDCDVLAKRLSQIVNFRVPNFELHSVEPFASLAQIKVLRLDNNELSDLKALTSLDQLTGLTVNDNHIESIAFVQHLPNLRSFEVGNNQITSIEPLRGHSHLQSIVLSGNPIDDLSPLATLKLDRIILNDLQMPDSGVFLKSQPALNFAQLNNTGLKHLGNIASKSNQALTYLSVKNNSISDLEPIRSKQALNVLYLNQNPITDLSPLADLPNIKALGISDITASAADVEAVLADHELIEIEAAGLGLSSLAWVDSMAKRLAAIEPNERRVWLDLRRNQISDPKEVSRIYQLDGVVSLRLAGNPIKSFDLSWLKKQIQLVEFDIDLAAIEDPLQRRAIRHHMYTIFQRSR